MAVLITGASGYIGNQIASKLALDGVKVIGVDIFERKIESDNYKFYKYDIRDKNLETIFQENEIDSVIHLACIVTPRPGMDREFMYSVDIDGTKNLLELVKKYQVKTLSVASSGAAYGYHKDNSPLLKESDPVRGNYEFPYSYHKALVENMLSDFKKENENLRLFVFRIGTVIGKNVNNQITDLFRKPFLIGIEGSLSPFVFIWDTDLVDIFIASLNKDKKEGIYNVAGTGAVDIHQMSSELNKRAILFPSMLLKSILYILKRIKLTQYGEEQVNFLRYRPVLDNKKLISEFGFMPRYTSLEAFREYLKVKMS